MENLPLDIALDLFSQLPAETVLECRRVCKAWRNLFTLIKANFAAMHNNGIVRSKVSTQGLIFLGKSVDQPKTTGHPLYYGEFDENNFDKNEQSIQNKLRLINHHPVKTRRRYGTSSLVGSCNGLICLGEPAAGKNSLLDPIHICNPITGECLYLQGFNESGKHHDFSRIYSGFGYVPQTNEYKVVRILYAGRSSRGYIQVYTLGGGDGWRHKGVITCWLDEAEYGVFANGAIHWLDGTNVNIMAFDLSDEKFHELPAGPFRARYHFTSILGSSYGGWLCASACDSNFYTKCIGIWTLKKTSSEKSTAAADNKDESASWCKEFSITLGRKSPSAWYYRTLGVTESGLVLLKSTHHYPHTVFCYDPKTATMKRLEVGSYFEAIPHTNSFVSLEALGETTCKKRS